MNLIEINKFIKNGLNNSVSKILSSQLEERESLNFISSKVLNSHHEKLFIKKSLKIDDLIANENLIEQFTDQLRQAILKQAFEHTYKTYKSPVFGSKKWDLNGNEVLFDYERTLEPRNLENKIYNSKKGYTGFSMLFSNGMSSLAAMYNYIYKMQGIDTIPRGINCCEYFETSSLSLMNRVNNNIKFSASLKDIDVSAYDFFIIEPIKADFKITLVDLEHFINKIVMDQSNKLKIIIVDSSLLGKSFNTDKILKKLHHKENVIFVNLRSGLKLDQQGLELCNCGIVDFYINSKHQKISDYSKEYLTKVRNVNGSTISYNTLCLLDNNIFLIDDSYSNKIINNNYEFYKYLSDIKLKSDCFIEKIYYPYNQKVDNSCSPYINIKLSNNIESEYIYLVNNLKKIFKSYHLDFISRNSFGFRNITFEYFKIVQTNEMIGRLAIGHFKGVKYHIYLYLIEYLLKVDTKKGVSSNDFTK